MVGYFRKMTIIITVLFFLAGGGLSYLYLVRQGGVMSIQSLSIMAVLPMFGIVLGRMVSSKAANARLAKICSILYTENDPQRFIDVFYPIVRDLDKSNIAYIDGCVKLSFAFEALGDFERALNIFENAKPSSLKMHSLQASAILCNQKLRVLLLMGDKEGSEEVLSSMRSLAEDAKVRAKMLAAQLDPCIKLGEKWLDFLNGGEPDAEYIKEEADLARNKIYKAEMLSLYADMLSAAGKTEEAEEARKEAAELVPNLYSSSKAPV